jgi:hypothetical protein
MSTSARVTHSRPGYDWKEEPAASLSSDSPRVRQGFLEDRHFVTAYACRLGQFMLVVTQPLVRVGVLDYGLGLAPREPSRFRIIRE